LAPSIVLGSIWPPIGINVLNPLHLPFLNTLILLTSGMTVTLAHYYLLNNTSTWPFSWQDPSTSKLIVKCRLYGNLRYYDIRWPLEWFPLGSEYPHPKKMFIERKR